MKITLLSKTIYDLDKDQDAKKLKNYISVLKARNKSAELQNICKQIEDSGLSTTVINTIYEKAGGKKAQPIPAPLPPVAPVIAPVAAAVIAVDKEEDGETSFQALYWHLIADMQNYAGDMNTLIVYSSLVTNFFMHAATYTPEDGHGKSQKREFNNKNQLRYYRSQNEHANAIFYRDLIKSKDDGATIPTPLNSGFTKLIENDIFEKEFCKEVKKIEPQSGRLKKDQKKGHFGGLQLGSVGAKKNNFSTLVTGMGIAASENEIQSTATLQKKLTSVLPATKKIEKLPAATLCARINELSTRFNTIETNPNKDENLFKTLLDYRADRVNQLKEKIKQKNFTHVKVVDNYDNITCLLLQVYGDPNKKTANATYSKGVTNVLVSFFSALINHLAQQKDLNLHIERRQSFGFLRPTVSDAGNLVIRLSLGTEPSIFDEIVLEALPLFEQILNEYNFASAENDSVKKAISRIDPKKTKGDTYLKNRTRSDDGILNIFRQAELYLKEEYTKDSANGHKNAMKRFLDDYIIEEKSLKKANPPTVKKAQNTEHSPASISLLNNVLNYALSFVKTLPQAQENMQLLHCYWHSLLKLHTHITDATTLLQSQDSVEAGEFHRLSTLACENILEYMISLQQLKQTYQAPQNKRDPIQELRNTEIAYYQQKLGVSHNQLKLHFTDSGQQAISSALIALSIVIGSVNDVNVYIHKRSYFEVTDFMEEARVNGITETNNIENAPVIFTDITQIKELNALPLKSMRAIIIDMTHHPLLDQEEIKAFIKKQHERGCWVVLVESALKHQQLGLDKYQTGKITTLFPANAEKEYIKAYNDLLDPISEDAIHPCVASYLQMVNDICQDKIQPPQAVSTPNAPVSGNHLIQNMRQLMQSKDKAIETIIPQQATSCKI